MTKKITGLKSIGIVAAWAVTLIITGCSVNSPMSPDSEQNTDWDNDEVAVVTNDVDSGDNTEPEITFESMEAENMNASSYVTLAIVASEGGIMEINNDSYSHSFEVEEYAIDSNLVISASVSSIYISAEEAIEFEFGPTELEFNIASTLVFDIGELSSGDNEFKFYYYNPSASEWQLQTERAAVNGIVEFSVSHFSKYAISD